MFTTIVKCRVCSSDNLQNIFSLPKIPLAGDFKVNQITKDEEFPLDLLFCSKCKVVQIAQTIDLNRLFNTYAFSSSTIPSLVEHFRSYAKWIQSAISPKKVLEVGCNDGILLEPLREMGIETFGVDMSINIGDLARAKGLNVQSIKFGKENLEQLKNWAGKVDLITASNAFPHNDDPNGFLQTAFEILNENGAIVLEVMYAGSLQEDTQWDTVYHEHLHIHSLTSITYLLELNGFTITHCEIVPMHAGSLRVIAKKGLHSPDTSTLSILAKESETNLNTLSAWKVFNEKSLHSIEIVKNRLQELSKSGQVWAYGASGRATMWLNAAEMTYVQGVVDASPLRAGRFMPGISTPILSPSEFNTSAPEYVFVTAWNYLDKIVAQHPNFTGKWIVPLPEYREL